MDVDKVILVSKDICAIKEKPCTFQEISRREIP